MKKWDGFAVFCFMISCAMLVKNVLILLVFLVQLAIARAMNYDINSVQMRPRSYGML